MEISELRLKDVAELKKQLTNLRKEYMLLRFKKASRSLENTSAMRKCRKNIAKVMTALHEVVVKN